MTLPVERKQPGPHPPRTAGSRVAPLGRSVREDYWDGKATTVPTFCPHLPTKLPV